jgi:hypothetical protein
MKNKLAFAALLLFSCLVNAQNLTVSQDEIPGEIIVRYKKLSGNSAMALEHNATPGLRVLRHVHGRAHLIKEMSTPFMHHLKVAEGIDHHALINELNHHPDVQYAEANHVVKVTQEQVLSISDIQSMTGSMYSVLSFSQNSANVKMSQAWQTVGSNGTPTVVAIVDTGIDYTHYVLTNSQAIWKNSGEIANNGIDDDGNGYVDDVYGWNFNANTNNPMDDNGHGTHVAGIAVGVGQNIFASALSKSNIKVMALKFMDSTGSGSTADAVTAINYAVRNGAKVINNSWGGSSYSQSLHDALSNAYANGLFIASAAGNYSTNDDSSPLYPANLPIPSQVSVAASDNTDSLASFSSFGPSTVQVASPGVSILSTYPNNTFAYLSGTSMASPFVAGLAALTMSQAPQLTGYQVKNIILGASDPVSPLSGLVSTGSRVDALSTVQGAQQNARTPASQPSYSATPPAGASSSSGGTSSASSSGCGLVSTLAAASGGDGMTGGATALALLCLPLAVWFFVRATSQNLRPYRRKYERFAVENALSFEFNGQAVSGRLSTLGLGGLSFRPEQALAGLAPGGHVRMSLESPDKGQRIDVQGQVVWSENGHAFGVKFEGLEPSSVQKLSGWLSKLG